MKITDGEMTVNSILSVRDGRIRQETCGCSRRSADGFIFVLSGKARYDFADKSFCAASGDVFYLPRNSTYTITILEREYRFIWVDFFFAWPEEDALEADVFHPGGGKAMEHIFVKLLNLWRFGDFSDKLLCRSILYEIYAAITKAAALKELSADHTGRLAAVMEYINAHYADPDLSVETLAELYQTSSVHFRRTFIRLYRTSPMKFITSLRLSRACELLQGTDLPVNRICRECGYTSVYYFDRVFKKEFGMQPLQFRRQSL